MHTIRIPIGRFAFFTSEFQDEFYVTEENYNDLNLPANAFELKKPDYLAINDALVKKRASIKGRLVRMKNLITGKNLDAEDITLVPSWNKQRYLGPIKNEINKESYKRLEKIDYEFLDDKKFILVTLHKQPEASIDVLGRYSEDQFRNIVDLWRILPRDWFLVVKEHSNAIGDRSFKWFRELAKLKNIVFAHEKLDSYVLIDMCQAVYTISGTIAYEAALKHKPALVLAENFFKFPYLKKVTPETFKNTDNFFELLKGIPDQGVDEERIKKKIYFNSFPGIISDPLNNPLCMEEENIIKVSKAVHTVLSTQKSLQEQ